ncbi:hypothetical protein FQN49_006833 [Arthroderma sp. PD_2]|nr:hypothetical protein FQN49_006833 [Arthroderma sp. PD_2]
MPAVKPKFAQDAYTVGWICALDTEYVAAIISLDEEHEKPQNISSHDDNIYTLGRINNHKVVIAVLPDGEYGTSSASRVATAMLNSFPNIRVGLMVGIGGGAPSQKNDIRLGDIVVSAPRDGYGGVFQYDYGKTVQNQSFHCTSFLNQPPVCLRTAISGIKAKYRIEGPQIEEKIHSILAWRRPALQDAHRRPDPASDRLYKQTVNHPTYQASCADACGNDPSKLEDRRERTGRDDNPAIHYGLIASGNQLIKDATFRDKLAAEKGVLCFEMEAAGLMNHFPCLVIRGVCDYSDSHKNKEWQGYAAVAAAVYAKDLLHEISPKKVESERRISEILSSVKDDIREMHSVIKETRNTAEDIAFKQKREEIRRWLSPSDPSTNHDKARSQCQYGTGRWSLQCDKYSKWKTQRSSFLWLHGITGCGKSILSSSIITNLQQSVPSQSLLYFYFDFRDTRKQTLDNMVRSFISQLYSDNPDTREHLDSLFSSCQHGHLQPSCESLCSVLLKMIERIEEVWVVIDALDECSTREGSPTKGLLSWIKDQLNAEQSNIHFLVTSRPEHDIKIGFNDICRNEDIVEIQSSLITDDILGYIRGRVRDGKRMERWRSHPDIQEEIETRVLQQANGMFRWVACQMDSIENCLEYGTLQSVLASLPATLDETYSRILHSIFPEQKQNAIRLLQFLTFSEGVLSILEAVDILAVNIEGDQYFNPKYRMPDVREISCYCSSLVVIVPSKEHVHRNDPKYAKLQLAHSSVKEYLTSNRLEKEIAQDFLATTARASIAKVCLAYLLQFDEELPLQQVVVDFPLAKYSARYWMDHAMMVKDKDAKLLELIRALYCYHEASYRVCYRLHLPDMPWEWFRPPEIPEPPLRYASFGGFRDAVQSLLSLGVDVNHGDALQVASQQGHEEVVELLLNKGADIDHAMFSNGIYRSALSVASENGHIKTVELLLSRGAKFNEFRSPTCCTPLNYAVAGGHETIVELLLSKGANIDLDNGLGTPLSAAIGASQKRMVELLLNRGANINLTNCYRGSPLCEASRYGELEIVKLLLSKGAEVNPSDRFGNYPLCDAVKNGHGEVAELLRSKGGYSPIYNYW